MFDWLGDLFSADTFDTLVQGANTAGSAFNAVAPIINKAASLGLGVEGSRNAAGFRAAQQQALGNLDSLFAPTGEYAQELRKQMERKDAAAGRRSQYGTRETELMTNLAKQRAGVLTSPAYQAYLQGANRSALAPLAGAVGNITGGNPLSDALKQASNLRSASQAGEYLAGLFGPAADASVAAGIGGAGSALGAGGLGNVGLMGAEGVSGLSGMLPSYAEAGGPQATGLFGQTAPSAAPLGGFAEGAAMLPGYASTAGTGAGIFGGGLTGAAGAPGVSGLSGLLPGYTATAGTGGAGGLFGGAGAAGSSGGAGGGAASGLGGLGTAAGVALPAAVLLGGLMSMFQQGTQPIDVSRQWMQNVNAAGGKNMTADQFGQIRGEQPTLNALLDQSMTGGVFDINKYNDALSKATVGGKRFEGDALTQAQNFGQFAAQNPTLMGTQASGPGSWWEQAAQQYGGG